MNRDKRMRITVGREKVDGIWPYAHDYVIWVATALLLSAAACTSTSRNEGSLSDEVTDQQTGKEGVTCGVPGSATAVEGIVPADGQRLVVSQFEFASSGIFLCNVSDKELDVGGWQVWLSPSLQRSLPPIAPLKSGAQVQIVLRSSLPTEETIVEKHTTVVWLRSQGLETWPLKSELAVYSSDVGDFSDHTSMEAYLRWGWNNEAPPSVKEEDATKWQDTPLWTPGEFLNLNNGTCGYVAAGDVKTTSGFVRHGACP